MEYARGGAAHSQGLAATGAGLRCRIPSPCRYYRRLLAASCRRRRASATTCWKTSLGRHHLFNSISRRQNREIVVARISRLSRVLSARRSFDDTPSPSADDFWRRRRRQYRDDAKMPPGLLRPDLKVPHTYRFCRHRFRASRATVAARLRHDLPRVD